MAWVPMKEAADRLRCSVDTIKRRTRLEPEDPRYLATEHENLPRGGYKILVEIPDDAPAPQAAPDAAPPLALPAYVEPPAQTDASAVVILLQHQAEAHEREIERLSESLQGEMARMQGMHAGVIAAKNEAIAAKDETIAVLHVERDAMQIQIEKLREQLARAQQRPWWRFWSE